MTVDADSVTVESGPLAGNVYEALEFFGSQPRFADTGPITGEAVYIGLACDEATTENAEEFPEGGVAIARRGECLFATKLATAAPLGADAIVIANNVGDTAWGGIRIWDYADPENPVLASTFNTVCSADPNDPSGWLGPGSVRARRRVRPGRGRRSRRSRRCRSSVVHPLCDPSHCHRWRW